MKQSTKKKHLTNTRNSQRMLINRLLAPSYEPEKTSPQQASNFSVTGILDINKPMERLMSSEYASPDDINSVECAGFYKGLTND